jgi:hypothetical protein
MAVATDGACCTSTVLAEETADALGCQVALRTGIDHERPRTGSSQHERGAEAGGSATHHDDIPRRLRELRVGREDPGAGYCQGRIASSRSHRTVVETDASLIPRSMTSR